MGRGRGEPPTAGRGHFGARTSTSRGSPLPALPPSTISAPFSPATMRGTTRATCCLPASSHFLPSLLSRQTLPSLRLTNSRPPCTHAAGEKPDPMVCDASGRLAPCDHLPVEGSYTSTRCSDAFGVSPPRT